MHSIYFDKIFVERIFFLVVRWEPNLLPDVTLPTSSPSWIIIADERGGGFPSSKTNPTLFEAGLDFCCFIISAQPGKFPSARRFFGTVNRSTAKSYVVFNL